MVNPQAGSFLFVSDWEKFTIPEDVVIIGIENMENFRMIRKQRELFENYLKTHDFQTEYSLYLDIHNLLILEGGCVLFQIIISISETLIWRELIYFS